MPELPTWFDAFDRTLNPLVNAMSVAALVAGLDEAGRLGGPDRTDDPLLGGPLALALSQHQVIDDSGALTPDWQSLTAANGYATLADTLESFSVMARLLRGLAAGRDDYWTMPAADRLVFARSISPNPFSGGLVAIVRRTIEEEPLTAPVLAGGRYLELGCGVAGRILTTLQASPTLTAVGVELSQELAAEAARRAQALGLAARFEVRCEDATTFSDPEPFDFGFWSQFFFPTRSREGALQTLLRSVRPGGLVMCPILDPSPEEAMFRLLIASWGVPLRTPDELAQEFTAAGFVDVQVRDAGDSGPGRLLARCPGGPHGQM